MLNHKLKNPKWTPLDTLGRIKLIAESKDNPIEHHYLVDDGDSYLITILYAKRKITEV